MGIGKTLLTIAAMAATPVLYTEGAQADEAPAREELTPPVLLEADASEPVITLEGTLVSQSPEEVVMRDGDGNEHHFRVNERTRYVWSETTSPSDLLPGAHVRADYASVSQKRMLVSLWVLGRS